MSFMTSTMAALVAALALCLALSAAYPTKDEEAYYYNRLHQLPDTHKDVRNLDVLGGGHLLRDLDELKNRAVMLSRVSREPTGYRFDSFGGNTLGGAKRSPSEFDSLGGFGIGGQKRNMDEIDRSSFNSFIKKNFDEIDRSGFGSFVKRNFDEIDRSGFGGFVKRSVGPAPAVAETAHN